MTEFEFKNYIYSSNTIVIFKRKHYLLKGVDFGQGKLAIERNDNTIAWINYENCKILF